MKFHIIQLGCLLAMALSLGRLSAQSAQARPNILFILTDDVGWGSVGAYGADPELVRTPNIDRLANEGRLFTDAYAPSSVCSPTRYAVLTGRYCWRTSLKAGVLGHRNALHIETDRVTVASLLREQGYATAGIGKWHLGFGNESPVDYTKPLRPGPLELGFDYYYGLASNHGDATGVYLDTVPDGEGGKALMVAGLRSTELNPFGKSHYGGIYYGLDAPQRVDEEVMGHFADKAEAWIRAQHERDTPFFLYYVPVELHEPITPSPRTQGTSAAGPYGDFIHDMDLVVGQLLGVLDELNLTDNTLVIFTSDNGGEDRRFVRESRQAIEAGLKLNGALREGKFTIYEGGIRVPFIARWPGRIPAGSVSIEPISLVDMLATFASAAGEEIPPADVGAEDSHNVLPALLGDEHPSPIRPPVIGHSGRGIFSIREGDWKWIEGIPANPQRWGTNPPELYNLRDDLGETNNLIEQRPEIAERLSALLNQAREQNHTR